MKSCIEVCPTPETDPVVTREILSLMKSMEQVPVLLKKELPGLISGRLEAALMMENLFLIQVCLPQGIKY